MNRSITPEELQSLIESGAPLTILDLRRKADYETEPRMVPGARWYAHEKIDDWLKTLPREIEVILYCAHGRTISNAALDRLLGLGFEACFIEGGMDAWIAAGNRRNP